MFAILYDAVHLSEFNLDIEELQGGFPPIDVWRPKKQKAFPEKKEQLTKGDTIKYWGKREN